MKGDSERFYSQNNLPYVQPFFNIDFNNDEAILDWFKNTDTTLNMYYQPHFREQKNNLQIFLNLGINPNFFSPLVAVYLQQGLVTDEPDEIYINEAYRAVIDQMSIVCSNELVAQVLPNNDDYTDKIAAKFVKAWLDSICYDLDIDTCRIKWEMQKKIFGEAFVVPIWDDEGGDILPEAKVYANEELFMVDENGREVIDEQGKLIKIRKFLRQGDVGIDNPMPYDVMFDPKFTFDECDWGYYKKFYETAFLERKYKKKLATADSTNTKYDPLAGLDKATSNHTKVYKFYHRSHPFLPEGRYIECTEDAVLVNKTLISRPTLIENRKLPFVRFCDLDIGFGTRGVPILMRNTRPIINGYNRITNQMYQNIEMASPKVLIHQTAGIDAQRMASGIIVMEWKGNVEPKIICPETNTNSLFKFREDIKKNILEMSLSTPMTRGDVPNAQLDSFIALQHFEDQRTQLASPGIKEHLKSMEHLFRGLIGVAKDYYDLEIDRLIKIVGKNNKFNLKYFKPENLQKIYDVKVTSTGNMANSKAARTQFMMTIKRDFPNMIPDDIFMDVLGLAQSEKFQNAITSAVNCAESENEDMLNGEAVMPPEKYEDLITHWDSHRIPMQGVEFKHSPPQIKNLFERHMTLTEKLMFEQARESPTFQTRLMQLKQFPMFYFPTPLNEPQMPQIPMDQNLGGVPQENITAPTAEDSEIPPLLDEMPA